MGAIASIQQVYNAKASVALANSPVVKAVTLSKSPVGYWRLNELVGAVAKDSSPGGHDGAVQPGVALGAIIPLPGDPNDAGMTFDGATGFVSYAGPNISQGDFSLAAWILGTSANWGGTTHAQVVGGGVGALAIEVSSNGGWFLTEVARHQGPSSGLPVIAVGTLTHLAVTFIFATKTVQFVKNGTFDAPRSFASYDPTTAAAQSRIGRTSAYSSAFPGVIKDVSIYNYALSAADISDLYLAGKQAMGALATASVKQVTTAKASVSLA